VLLQDGHGCVLEGVILPEPLSQPPTHVSWP
jgi:hypothetical protein